ncbi:MAG TPA: DUF3795 domain-containing protein [Anaeromyxobacteraceae bacterium]|nr:DUF3795 domain-containing protein [Anaeromyxobacteraceae bacterium]
MTTIVAEPNLVAACGLYCGACGKHLAGRCPGCRENERAGWCRIRSCCAEHGYATCADCAIFEDPRECAKYDNLVARVIGFVLRSNRAACVDRIREVGRDAFAAEMAAKGAQSLPRR